MKRVNKKDHHHYNAFSFILIIVALLLIVLVISFCAPKLKSIKSVAMKITCRDYLLQNEAEKEGYGLYSYLLFSRKPVNEKEVQRYLALHRAYRTLHSEMELEQSKFDDEIGKQNINITYWLLQNKSIAKDKLDSLKADDKFFVNNYDYLRADLILKAIKGIKTPGPFIIAYYYPLSKLPSLPNKDEMLIIDMSRIEQSQFIVVLDHFQKKVADDPKTWHTKFDWEMIRIHIYSALKLHGKPVLFAAKWVGGFFDIKKAFAK